MQINELSFADYKVTSTLRDSNSLCISFSGSYDITNSKHRGATSIKISAWSGVSIKIYEIDEMGKTREVLIDPTENSEPFELIQEVEQKDQQLFLRGFGKESGSWMVYEFTDAKVDVKIE
ncbi:MAG: hypothetical protein HYZ14_12475 [Bacteroidetes bacterium]|nr:hypothetical protein [Bacteroidota bacterium]